MQEIAFEPTSLVEPSRAPGTSATLGAESTAPARRSAARRTPALAEKRRRGEEAVAAMTNEIDTSTPARAGASNDDERAIAAAPHAVSGVEPPRPRFGARAHGPRLLTPGACSQSFPLEAHDDHGAVIVALRVHASGTAFAPSVVSEEPPRQGFGSAALHCASLLKFAPAENGAGARVPSISVVRLRFARARAE